MKKVLIIDDAEIARLSSKSILEKYGFEVVGVASNRIDAVELYKELKPDIVLMDIAVSESKGVEMLRRIKDIDRNARVIFISEIEHAHMINEAILAGAIAFIISPYKENELLQTSI